MTTMTDLLNEPGTTVALVGATETSWKYGSKILHNLRGKGFTVFAVNRHRQTVAGAPAYRTLADLPERPTIINVVVPPPEGPGIIRQVAELGWDNVWFQPGAESAAARAVAAELGVTILDDACTMVVAQRR